MTAKEIRGDRSEMSEVQSPQELAAGRSEVLKQERGAELSSSLSFGLKGRQLTILAWVLLGTQLCSISPFFQLYLV